MIPITPGANNVKIKTACNQYEAICSTINSKAKPVKIKIGGKIKRKCRKPSYMDGLRKSTYKTKITNQSKTSVREIILFLVVPRSNEDLSDCQLAAASASGRFLLRLLY